MKYKYYLAYGSNLCLRQMAYRCPDAAVVGRATLQDYRLIFRGSQTGSYLTVEPCIGASVPCGVFKISKADELSLDCYEGYPIFYRKEDRRIDMIDDKTGEVRSIIAMIYIMGEDRPIGVPSEGYLQTCGEGYLDFNFDLDPLEEALEYSRRLANIKGGIWQ
jgi:gamma-glutamylcyclotransferase (GGCT)/AIG2-like uncharacterized protein YtfP